MQRKEARLACFMYGVKQAWSEVRCGLDVLFVSVSRSALRLPLPPSDPHLPTQPKCINAKSTTNRHSRHRLTLAHDTSKRRHSTTYSTIKILSTTTPSPSFLYAARPVPSDWTSCWLSRSQPSSAWHSLFHPRHEPRAESTKYLHSHRGPRRSCIVQRSQLR